MTKDRVSEHPRSPTPPSRGRALAAAIDPLVLRAQYEAGASTVDLSHTYGVSRTTLRKLLNAAGTRLRDVAAARQVRTANVWLTLERPQPVRFDAPVEDVFGVSHRVWSMTPTDLGWDILRGLSMVSPVPPLRVILTHDLVAHLEQCRLHPGRHGLPLSAATIYRLRQRLAFDWRVENRAWWLAHRQELAETDIATFARTHGVHIAAAYHVRRLLHGTKRKRAPGSGATPSASWWNAA